MAAEGNAVRPKTSVKETKKTSTRTLSPDTADSVALVGKTDCKRIRHLEMRGSRSVGYAVASTAYAIADIFWRTCRRLHKYNVGVGVWTSQDIFSPRSWCNVGFPCGYLQAKVTCSVGCCSGPTQHPHTHSVGQRVTKERVILPYKAKL